MEGDVGRLTQAKYERDAGATGSLLLAQREPHAAEPGCALRTAVEAGQVSRLRFESFLHLREELETEEQHTETRSRRGRL